MSNLEINFDDFSNGAIVGDKWEGTGVFDQLMMAISGNVQVQYDAGRIKGSGYTKTSAR